jgi:AraC family transcriptional regulator
VFAHNSARKLRVVVVRGDLLHVDAARDEVQRAAARRSVLGRSVAHGAVRAALDAGVLVAAGLVRGETPDGEAIEQVLGDLLASLADDGRARETGLPPPWLRRIREQLDTAPESTSVAAAAHEAGVHRVHLARMFRRHYGLPVSAYRRLARNAVAVRRVLGEDQVLAGAANDAGFSDQCHMTRALRADTGFTPGALCRLLR